MSGDKANHSQSALVHTTPTYGVLVFVRVDARVHDPSKEVVHDEGQGLCVEHAMQRAYKHSLTGDQPLGRAAHKVTVNQHPRDYLHLRTCGEGEDLKKRNTEGINLNTAANYEGSIQRQLHMEMSLTLMGPKTGLVRAI